LTEGEASSLLLVDKEASKLYFEIALGAKADAVRKYSLNIGEGIAGWVAQHNTSLIINDVESDKRHYVDISKKIDYPSRTMLAVPMRMKDECIGVIGDDQQKTGKIFPKTIFSGSRYSPIRPPSPSRTPASFEKAREEIHFLQDQIKTDRATTRSSRKVRSYLKNLRSSIA
jgi:Nif-specific regulatory protein